MQIAPHRLSINALRGFVVSKMLSAPWQSHPEKTLIPFRLLAGRTMIGTEVEELSRAIERVWIDTGIAHKNVID